MWPFFKSLISGLYRQPTYRLMESGTFPGRYYLWHREKRYVAMYFNNLDEALLHIEMNNIDCDPYRAFR